MRDPRLAELFERRNAVRDVAAACDISTSAVAQWDRVPWARRETVASALGVRVSDLPVGSPARDFADKPGDGATRAAAEGDVNLAEAIRRRLAPLGGVDLPAHPPTPMRPPPSFSE